MTSQQSSRQFKTNWMRQVILKFFSKHPKKTISKRTLIADFALHHASTRRTGLEIIGLLQDSNFIKIEGDEISKSW